ncbi:hypothetical protein GDO86_015245 [Hymenochirus boettgeri]|uniref:Uncharacterized protein n=1 Tax=Hymenochirus boettgeri TaxID=247094 RepID=A0A8T2JVW0_9PIPI|nr:hypothetical protein GDO86_015245 [Hymenochirus boettgeri]
MEPPEQLLDSSAVPAVLSPGSILASTQGSGGQQILHVIHTIPSVNLPSKMGNLQTPCSGTVSACVYTTLPTDGVTAAITVPLIGADGKCTVKTEPESPVEINSDSDESMVETSSSFQDPLLGPHLMRMQRGEAGSPDLRKRRFIRESRISAHGRLHMEICKIDELTRHFRKHPHQTISVFRLRPSFSRSDHLALHRRRHTMM